MLADRARVALRRLDTALLYRGALLAAAIAGAALLVVADFTVLREIRVVTVIDEITAGDEHGYALTVLGIGALPIALVAGIWRDRRAAAGLAWVACVALAVALLNDLPALDDTGEIDDYYGDVTTGMGTAMYLELLGAALLGGAGTGLARLTGSGGDTRGAEVRSGRARAFGPAIRALGSSRWGRGR